MGTDISDQEPSDVVEATARRLGIPGVAVGIWAAGRERFACHGITSVENPLPVDADTMFIIGSVTKTFTATALMRLVARGEVDLAAPVRRYVPELRLADETVASQITVLQLLNHTAGLGHGLLLDSGDGDDAIARYVAKLPELELVAVPGTRASYSQAGFDIVGRIIEKVTGLTYEQAIALSLFEPLDLSHSFYLASDVLSRRFAIGHNAGEDGTMSVARLWKRWRGDNPGGGLASSVADLIRWARFHLGDGRAPSGEEILPDGLLQRMQEPTVKLHASALGDALGIAWFLRDVDGVRTVGHGGSTNGQFAELLLVPEREFAVVSMANAGPNGIPFNHAVVRWALERFVGLVDRDPEPIPYDDRRAREVVGTYDIDAMRVTIRSDGTGLTLAGGIKSEIRSAATTELPPDYPPAAIGLLPTGTDEYIVLEGGLKGQRGYFTRDGSGAIVGVDLAGRVFNRTPGSADGR
jgi:CubicO group peptidase (beta-lactamase class C family)